jgi:dipeptidase D
MKPDLYPTRPQILWDQFYQFTLHPRPSKKEDQIRKYIITLAQKNKIPYRLDQQGNLALFVPASKGYESAPSVLIQNHLDMVCDALPGKKINFETDGLQLKIQDDWLLAQDTTLGADNGLGCAAALALILDEKVIHPKLEILFTVDEETGLGGALNLSIEELGLVSETMINLDTEDWGILYVGCAGGFEQEFTKDIVLVETNHSTCLQFEITGLCGGHSGIEIHLQHGNAIKLMIQALTELEPLGIELMEMRGGKAHNIIPRDALALFTAPDSQIEKIENKILEIEKIWKAILPKADQNLKIKIKKIETLNKKKVMSKKDFKHFLSFHHLFPNGAHLFDWRSTELLVSVSNNLAISLFVNEKLYTLSSTRFLDRPQSNFLLDKYHSLAEHFNYHLNIDTGYPSWKPIFDSPVVNLVKSQYEILYGETPNVAAIHAGLECGIIKDKMPDVDIVSFGPTIKGAHSPTERVHIPSVEKFWTLLLAVMKKLAQVNQQP